MMARWSQAISDELYEQAKQSLKILGRRGEVGRRLQAIVSAKVHGIKAVASIYAITRTTLMSWIKNFQRESVSGLSIKAGRGRRPYLSLEVQEEIRQLIKGKPSLTLRDLKQHIADQYSLFISLSTVHRLLKKLSFSYITPRPVHHQSNPSLQEEFKKKSSSKNKRRAP
jgi:transposase